MPAPTRLFGRDVAIALSLANLCYARIWSEILAVTSTDAYFLSVANSDVGAVMMNVLLLAGVFLGATAFARRLGRKGRLAIAVGFAAVLIVQLNGLGPELAPGVLALVERWKNGLYLEVVAIIAVLLGIFAVVVRWPRPALRGTVQLI